MERHVEENRSGRWKLLKILCGIVMVMIVSVAVIARDWKFALLAGAFPLMFRFAKKSDEKTAERNPRSWLVSDTGLVRVYGVPPQRETIRWDCIRSMRWVSLGGMLIINWEKTGPRSAEFKAEFKNEPFANIFVSRLRVDKAQADELADLWQKYRVEATAADALDKRPVKLSASTRRAFALCTGIGLFFIGWAAYDVIRDLPSRSWPVVTGNVIHQQIEDVPSTSRDSTARAQVTINYSYSVDGHDYVCDQYRLRRPTYSDTKESAVDFARQHPQGSAIPVYYNPKDPHQAVLAKGPDWNNVSGGLVGGGFFIGISLFLRKLMLAQAPGRRKPEQNSLFKEYGR